MSEGNAQLFQRRVDPYDQQDKDEDNTNGQMTGSDPRSLDQQIAHWCSDSQEGGADDTCDDSPECYALEDWPSLCIVH